MSRCELTQKGPVVANLVSHSNIKTKTVNLPNVQYKALYSQALNRAFTLKVAASTIRTIEHRGTFDGFILSQPNDLLSRKAQGIKRKIKQKLKAKTVKTAVEASAPVAVKAPTAKKAAGKKSTGLRIKAGIFFCPALSHSFSSVCHRFLQGRLILQTRSWYYKKYLQNRAPYSSGHLPF